VQIPEILESVVPIIPKFCVGPEFLDQLFRSNRNAMHIPEIVEIVFWILPEGSACSRNAGTVCYGSSSDSERFENLDTLTQLFCSINETEISFDLLFFRL
jgi:hypothetical protein